MVKHNAIEGKELSDSKGNNSWVVDKMSMARFMLCPQNRRRAVYFIGAPLLGMVKIGVAKNPYKRIDELQTGSPEILHMVGMYPLEGRECEKEFHERFAEYRAHGEWFRDEGELRRFLEKEFRNGNE